MAALLNRQKPIAVAVSAWWPGGRAATKTLSAAPEKTSSTAAVEAPTALIAASQLLGLTVVSASSRDNPSEGMARRILST